MTDRQATHRIEGSSLTVGQKTNFFSNHYGGWLEYPAAIPVGQRFIR